jgi:MoaA/NifB/PqqE/SkfB family radical SAM enzyme
LKIKIRIREYRIVDNQVVFLEKNKVLSKNELILVITRRCNLNCVHCPVEKKGRDLSEKYARKAIDIFLENNAKSGKKALKIRFFGGEPFLQWEKIKRLMKYASQRSSRIIFDITTNGTLLSDNVLEFIAERKNIELIISFHESFFYKKIKPYLEVISRSKKILFNIKVNPESVHNLAHDFIFLHRYGIRRFNILPAYYVLWGKKEIEKLVVQFQKVLLYIRLQGQENFYIKNVHVKSEVPLFNSSLTLDIDGKVYSNSMILDSRFKKIKKFFYLGEAFNKGFVKIFSRKYSELLDKSLGAVLKEDVLRRTFLVDFELSKFVENLRKTK